MKRPNKLALDGDILAFKASAAVETRYIIAKHIASGNEKRFKTRTEFWGHHSKKAGGWLSKANEGKDDANKFLPSDFEIKDEAEAEEVSHACQVVKQMIKGICTKSGVEDYEVFLDGRDNFRIEAATMVEYKGDRPSQKPIHLQTVEDYLVKVHGATYSDGIETDDIISIKSATGESISCTIDKDNLQVVGWLFDWEKMGEPIEITNDVGKLWKNDRGKVRGIGFKHLMHQMLIGDTTDNILPRHLCGVSFGEKSSLALLKDIPTKQECLQAVMDKYKEWYPEAITHEHWETGESLTKTYVDVASEIFTLLWMLRSWEDKTTLRAALKELGVICG